MKRITIAILGLALLSACGKKKDTTEAMTMNQDVLLNEPPGNSDVVSAVAFPPPVVKDDAEVTKKIIKEGDIRFQTDNMAATRKAIYDQLAKLNGYASGENESNNGENNQKEYTINAKVPAKNFDSFLTSVSANAVAVDSKNISMRDVTAQYIDITTRLSNKKKLEERYLELLKKGSKISDLLEIENKLTEIRSSIESTQGQLNYLSKQVDFSSLDITFYTKQSVKDNGQTFGYKLKRSFAEGWETLGNLFFCFIGWWPIWLIMMMLFLLIKRWRSNIRKRKS